MLRVPRCRRRRCCRHHRRHRHRHRHRCCRCHLRGVEFPPFPLRNHPRGKAITPLHHCRGVAEPELLVRGVGDVRARAGNISPRRPRHCPYHGRRHRHSETGGVPPTIAPYSSVVLLLLVVVVLMPHRLKPTPPSVVIAIIIGALPGAAQHVEEVGGLTHREPLIVRFLDLVAIGWAEGALAVRPLPPPARSLLFLLVPTFLPPNLHPVNGNGVAYGLWLDCAAARILSLNNDMGGNDKDCNDKDNNDTGDGDCNNGGEGRGRQRHQQWRHPPPPNNDIVIA